MGLKIVSGLSRPEARISLCMIVKDEEDNLGRCLRSVEGTVDEIIVVDTGSTDGSVAIAERHGARVIHEPWKGDFAAARNVGIDAATGEWILFLDADEELMGGEVLKEIVADADDLEGFYLREVSYVGETAGVDAVVHQALRLFRNRPAHRFDGALHEQISNKLEADVGTVTRLVGGAEILHYGYLDGAVADRAKTDRNREIALAEAVRRPDDSFTLFNAGIEYQRISEHERAVYFFRQSFQALPDIRRSWAPPLLRAFAASLRLLDRHDEALEMLADAQSAYPDFGDLYYIEALCHSDRREYRAAVDALRRAIAVGDGSAGRYMAQLGMGTFHAHAAMGVLSERLGDKRQAVRSYKDAVTSAKGCFPAPQQALVRLCLGTDDGPAVRDFVLGILPERQRVDSLRAVAEAFAAHGEAAIALELLDQVLAAEPDDLPSRLARADALLRLDRPDEALEEVARIPASSDLATGAAHLAYLAGIAAGREDVVSAAITDLADVADGLDSFVHAAVVEDAHEGRPAAEMPDRFSREDAIARALGLAQRLLAIGRLDEFNAAIRLVYGLAEDPSEVDEVVGVMLYDADFPGPAAARLIGAVEAGVASPEALSRLGRLCMEQDLAADARQFMRAALDAEPENQSRYVDLVGVLASVGDYAAATEVLYAALAPSMN
jgi:glycosyltransferase involved in cell wall biosynthesis/Tfp pilus assembly protein PilF